MFFTVERALFTGRIGLNNTHGVLLVGIRRRGNFELLP
jgi:hypothetical protein